MPLREESTDSEYPYGTIEKLYSSPSDYDSNGIQSIDGNPNRREP